MVAVRSGPQESLQNGQSSPNMGNGAVVPNKPTSGADTDTPSGIMNGSGPNGQPGNHLPPPDQALADQTSSSNGPQKLSPSHSKPEAAKGKDGRANATKPTIPPRPYRPPRPFPPPTKQGTRSGHRTPTHAPSSQDVPQSTPTPTEGTTSAPEDKKSPEHPAEPHEPPAESHDPRATQVEENGTAGGEEERGEGKEGGGQGPGTANVLYQPKTLFDESTAHQDEVSRNNRSLGVFVNVHQGYIENKPVVVFLTSLYMLALTKTTTLSTTYM